MVRNGWLKVLGLAACLGAVTPAALAQDATSGSISGTVKDKTGALVKGATVTLTNTDRNQVERTVTTNASGFYTATALPLGHYSLKIVETGFQTETLTGIVLNVDDALTFNRTLGTGGATETVEVTSDAFNQVNLQDATQAGLINGTQINELVMISRNYETLVNLQPGVAYGGTTDQIQRGPIGVNGASSTAVFSVNGGRSTSNNWTIDGADNLDRGSNLTLYVYPSPDSISEFKTLRGNYSAAFGRNSSGQVDVVTKSGANAIHGSAYEYFRNDFLDAKTYIQDTLGQPITKYRYNDFGFSLGGPVYIPKVYNGRNKTFWFVSENWLKEITYTSGTTGVNIPTPAEISGDFSNEWYLDSNKTSATYNTWIRGPVNVCTAYTNNAATQTNTCTATGTKVTNFSPAAQAYLKDVYSKIPQNSIAQQQAYAARGIDPHSLYATLRNEYPNLDSVVRIDQQFGQKVTAFYRYVHDTFPEFIGAGTFTQVPIPGLSSTYSNDPGTQHLGKVAWVVNPTVVANIGYAYSKGQIVTRPTGGLLQSASPDVTIPEPFNNTTGILPTVAVSGFQSITATPVYTDHGINHQAFGDVTKQFHNHTFITGVSYSHYNKQENATSANVQGSFGFISGAYTNVPLPTGQTQSGSINEAQAFANFLIGNANNGFSQSNRNPVADVSQQIWEGYFQDNWRATPRLTVNAGIRYEYFTQPTDAAGYLNNFDPATYSAAAAPTIANTGLICTTGTCNQTGSNAGQSTTPNGAADIVGPNYINGLIYGTPDATKNNQASPFGKAVSTSQSLNFAPRVGFAYDLFGDGKTAFRAGYGIAFDELEVSAWETTIGPAAAYGINPPGATTCSVTQAVLDGPSGCAVGNQTLTNNTAPGHLYAVPINTKTPYVQQYSMGIQNQLSGRLFFELDYVGSHGTHLGGQEEINQPHPGAWRGVVQPQYSGYTATATTGAGCNYLAGSTQVPMFWNSTCDRVLNQIKPYKGYYAIDTLQTIFSNNYNSLQAKVTLRGKDKSYIDGNFTWSRDLTNNPGDSVFVQDIYNVNGDYGRAAYDRKLIFNIDGVYELPWFHEQHGLVGRLVGGWEVSGILAMNSGIPYTVSSSGATSITYNGGAQPITYASNPSNLGNDNAGLALLGNTNGGIRPNQVGNPNSGGLKPLRQGHQYLSSASLFVNTSAFVNTDPLSDTPGTAKRGSINGPGFIRADVGIFRNFRIYDNLVFQLRGEAFNVANHPNVASIGTSATSTSFGEATGYRDPRILQIAGRITF